MPVSCSSIHSTHPPDNGLISSPMFSRSFSADREERSDDQITQQSGTPTKNFIDYLSDPINQLQNIFQDLIDYKTDTICAREFADQQSCLLAKDPPLNDQLKTVMAIHNVARNQACRLGLVLRSRLIRELILILQNTHSTDLQTEAALNLQLFVKTAVGAKLLLAELGIPILVKMLQHPSEIIRSTGLYLLNQLMWRLPYDARPAIRTCSGPVALANLLQDGQLHDPNWVIICVDAIRMATYRDQDAKLSLLDTNMHLDLVRLLRVYWNHPKLSYNIARLIKVLGTCPENKVKLVECGAVEALALLLQSPCEFLQLEALWGVRNLSDHAFHLDTAKNLISNLINLLASTDENISICAAGCLCNLTCQNAHNKEVLVENGGVTRLCQLLMLNPQRQEITEPVCSALRHVTHRSPHYKAAIFEVCSNHALPTIAALLDQDSSISALPLIKSVVGLIRNLALEEEPRVDLKSLGVATSLVTILKRTVATMQTAQSNHDSLGFPVYSECVEGVVLEDMIELCLIALHILSRDTDIRKQLIKSAGLLTTVTQFLYTNCEAVQRAAVALLSQLASSRHGAKAIEQEGICPRLTELVQSKNEYIAAYSAAVLHRITLDKPEDYRKRLSVELRQSLFDGGLLSENNRTNVPLVSTKLLDYLQRITPHSVRSRHPSSVHRERQAAPIGIADSTAQR